MFIIKKTGLVPVKDATTGEVFGVMPDVARTNVTAGKYGLVTDIPEEYETEEVDGPEVDENGFFVQPTEGDRRGNTKKKADDNGEPVHVDIPEDWRNLQHLQRVKLAKDLFPDYKPTTENGKWTADLADQKIQEMVDTRTNAKLV